MARSYSNFFKNHENSHIRTWGRFAHNNGRDNFWVTNTVIAQWIIPLRAMRGVWLSAIETRTGRGRKPSLCDEPGKANHKVSLSKPISSECLASAGEEFLCLLSCRYKKVGRSRRERKNSYKLHRQIQCPNMFGYSPTGNIIYPRQRIVPNIFQGDVA